MLTTVNIFSLVALHWFLKCIFKHLNKECTEEKGQCLQICGYLEDSQIKP